MLSTTHTIMALAILGKKNQPNRNISIFLGSIIPDAFIYICAGWIIYIQGATHERMWNEIYFSSPMQLTASIFNSVPIYTALALTGWSLLSRHIGKALWAQYLLFFALAALIHIIFDFPVHSDDAYAHFWPLSEWRFHSPVSYWDPRHHAGIVSIIETIIAFACIAILWRRFTYKWSQTLLLLTTMIYAALILSRVFVNTGAI